MKEEQTIKDESKDTGTESTLEHIKFLKVKNRKIKRYFLILFVLFLGLFYWFINYSSNDKSDQNLNLTKQYITEKQIYKHLPERVVISKKQNDYVSTSLKTNQINGVIDYKSPLGKVLRKSILGLKDNDILKLVHPQGYWEYVRTGQHLKYETKYQKQIERIHRKHMNKLYYILMNILGGIIVIQVCIMGVISNILDYFTKHRPMYLPKKLDSTYFLNENYYLMIVIVVEIVLTFLRFLGTLI